MSLWSATAALLRREGRALADFLFPACCALCQGLLTVDEEAVCAECLAAWRPLPSSHCPCCAEPYPAADGSRHHCAACLGERPPFARLLAGGLYSDGLREALHLFKYGGRLTLARPLARRMAQAAEDVLPPGAVLCPVPMHPRRLRQRGYNPALLLARELSRSWALPLDLRALVRVRDGVPQQGLNAEARRRNQRGAYAATPLRGPVILVDDVCTTTATLRECSRVLLCAGAPVVWAVVAARAAGPTFDGGERA